MKTTVLDITHRFLCLSDVSGAINRPSGCVHHRELELMSCRLSREKFQVSVVRAKLQRETSSTGMSRRQMRGAWTRRVMGQFTIKSQIFGDEVVARNRFRAVHESADHV